MVVEVSGLSSLSHGESITFSFLRSSDGRELMGFVIKVGEGYRAYFNRCNHWPVELDMGDGDFYYDRIDRITCKSHGATYRLEDGFCDGGPCTGSSLKQFSLTVEGNCGLVDTGEM